MQPLVGLPRTGHIQCNFTTLKIENHIVQNIHGLLDWTLEAVSWGGWDIILPQLIRQEFKIGGVIEQCVKDLQDHKKQNILFGQFSKEPNDEMKNWEEKSAPPQVEEFFAEIITRLKNCKNWDDFYDVINMNSKFRKEMRDKMEQGVKSCNR